MRNLQWSKQQSTHIGHVNSSGFGRPPNPHDHASSQLTYCQELFHIRSGTFGPNYLPSQQRQALLTLFSNSFSIFLALLVYYRSRALFLVYNKFTIWVTFSKTRVANSASCCDRIRVRWSCHPLLRSLLGRLEHYTTKNAFLNSKLVSRAVGSRTGLLLIHSPSLEFLQVFFFYFVYSYAFFL